MPASTTGEARGPGEAPDAVRAAADEARRLFEPPQRECFRMSVLLGSEIYLTTKALQLPGTIQVLGYTVSKFLGIRFIAEINPRHRAVALIALVGMAELSLVGFAIVPPPWNAGVLFFNGLALGMVFGLVMGFLEGRRQSEAMLAGLCSSFVAAPGVTKGVGAWVMARHVSEFWMPSIAGLIFFVLLIGFVWALNQIPRPDGADVVARSRREAIGSRQRWALFFKYAPGFTLIMIGYLLLTVLRSIRGDFAAEIWDGLGVKAQAALGYTGGPDTVRRLVTRWRTDAERRIRSGCKTGPRSPAPLKLQRPGSNRLSWLLVKDDIIPHAGEQALTMELRKICEPIRIASDLARSFGDVVRGRDVSALTTWTDMAMQSTSTKEMNGFAEGLIRNWQEVSAAVGMPWSNGRTEGHVNRLKLIKRKMYGRAKLDLLRIRVLGSGP